MGETDSSLNSAKLFKRVQSLEQQLREANEKLSELQNVQSSQQTAPLPQPLQIYDHSRYSSRLIALKFAYLGQNYHGYEHHRNNPTSTPTIEELLWRALVKTRLIWPKNGDPSKVDWTGMDYSKCGRTDKGVSAFGQVIGIRVKSNKPLSKEQSSSAKLYSGVSDEYNDTTSRKNAGQDVLDMTLDPPANETENPPSMTFDDSRDELPYLSILNRVLPPQVRMLAWCPSPPEDFSARFSCRERRYRYFFTQPAFNPSPGTHELQKALTCNSQGQPRRDGWLDINLMREAAKKYEGLHDFRNFCKVDPSKQIENFQRRMFLSDIREVDPLSEPGAYVLGKGFSEIDSSAVKTDSLPLSNGSAPRVYQFVLHGSAFLWHQVRHMVAVLFLIGQGLESPSLIDELLDVKSNPCKPAYEMADDAPLVLWDCIFPENNSDNRHRDALPWIWIGDSTSGGRMDKFGRGAVVDEVWQLWRRHKIDEILAGSLLNLAVNAGGESEPVLRTSTSNPMKGKPVGQWVYQGGVAAHPKGLYVPVMKKKRAEAPEVLNARYRAKKEIFSTTIVYNKDE